MFYSHDMLARKAQLGQIWMVATLYEKLNRTKLNQINLIQICEEIMNPRVPMSLRLSGILMGGVVMVQNQKMKILHDDVNRLLVELNRAWKVKPNTDPTLLPRRRAQAKKEAITLSEPDDTDLEPQGPHYSQFQQQTSGYFIVELDKVNMVEVETLPGEGDQHQADPEDITLPERYDPSANLFNCCCERFETEGDDNDDDDEMVEIPIPSPPRQDQRQQPGVMHGENVQPLRGRRRKRQACVLDNDQTIIPAHVYQSWLKDTSDIVSRRRRNPKPKNIMSTVNIIPASVLMGGLFKPASGETYYPPPLLELWKEKPTHDSPPALESLPLPPEPSSLSPDTPVEGYYGGHSSQPFTNHDVPPELMDELIANLDRMSGDDINLATPENSGTGDERRSIPSTSSGKGVSKNSSRSNRKRSNDGLEPVSDDNGCHHPDQNLKASRLSGNGPTLEQELLMETGPTQTQESIFDLPLEEMTDEVRKELKSHFETPGGPQAESLDNLTTGKNRREAALLFYQTCVLATHDFVKVEQKGPYEDILITPGPNIDHCPL